MNGFSPAASRGTRRSDTAAYRIVV